MKKAVKLFLLLLLVVLLFFFVKDTSARAELPFYAWLYPVMVALFGSIVIVMPSDVPTRVHSFPQIVGMSLSYGVAVYFAICCLGSPPDQALATTFFFIMTIAHFIRLMLDNTRRQHARQRAIDEGRGEDLA